MFFQLLPLQSIKLFRRLFKTLKNHSLFRSGIFGDLQSQIHIILGSEIFLKKFLGKIFFRHACTHPSIGWIRTHCDFIDDMKETLREKSVVFDILNKDQTVLDAWILFFKNYCFDNLVDLRPLPELADRK